MYTMTGLYSEAGDDSSVDVPPEESEYSETSCSNNNLNNQNSSDASALAHANAHAAATALVAQNSYTGDTVIKCHSRQASSGLVDRDKSLPNVRNHDVDDLSQDCGLLGCRPAAIQKFARIKARYNFFFF